MTLLLAGAKSIAPLGPLCGLKRCAFDQATLIDMPNTACSVIGDEGILLDSLLVAGGTLMGL